MKIILNKLRDNLAQLTFDIEYSYQILLTEFKNEHWIDHGEYIGKHGPTIPHRHILVDPKSQILHKILKFIESDDCKQNLLTEMFKVFPCIEKEWMRKLDNNTSNFMIKGYFMKDTPGYEFDVHIDTPVYDTLSIIYFTETDDPAVATTFYTDKFLSNPIRMNTDFCNGVVHINTRDSWHSAYNRSNLDRYILLITMKLPLTKHVITYNAPNDNELDSSIVYCVVDNTSKCRSDWIREIVKNQADYTVNNITAKGYTVLQGTDEDTLIEYASEYYDHAVIFKTGTEFINGDDFFNHIEDISKNNIALAGHILDHDIGYYELHDQCYYINLNIWKQSNNPKIGQLEFDITHTKTEPLRSEENFHDDYTPLWIKSGNTLRTYQHQAHGWNILSHYLNLGHTISVFNEKIRSSKIYLYPEDFTDFHKNCSFLYKRQHICLTEFVHTSTTDHYTYNGPKIKQLITPASGSLFENFCDDDVKIVMYDYNLKSLDYWKNIPTLDSNYTYEFTHIDLLADDIIWKDILDTSLEENTLINLTNIFAYEATAPFASLHYRMYRENKIIQDLKELIPNGRILFSRRSWQGYKPYSKNSLSCKIKDCEIVQFKDLNLPTWHIN